MSQLLVACFFLQCLHFPQADGFNADRQCRPDNGPEMSAQEVPIRLLHKLGELYGDNPPGVVGFSVESKDCPDFIGGVYINDRDTLVIQIRGDSAAVRKQLEEVLDSKEFIVEPAGAYTRMNWLLFRTN